MKPLNVSNLGLQPYDSVLELQHRMVAARREGRAGDTLLLLQHPPVITLGRRGNEDNILDSREWLEEKGIRVHRVERGGDVTYHGPGQLVGYPIMDLTQHRTDIGWFMHSLEEVLIRTLADFGIVASTLPGTIGVWLDERTKIASLGVRIENWIAYHGFALNVAQDVSTFQLIVPCGLTDTEITSMERVLGHPIEISTVSERVVDNFCAVFAMKPRRIRLEELVLGDRVED